MPFFSIVIPTYNRAYMIPKSIDSVIAQTYVDWELIIVDDGSTDNTNELIESYISKDTRIKYIYQQNAERSAARNNGINHASGEYICFLDSDDYYLKDRLDNLYKFIQNRKQKEILVFTGIIFENENHREIREVQFSSLLEINIFDYLTLTIIGTPQLCISRSILSRIQFNPRVRIGEDLELCFRIALKYPLIPQGNNLTIIATEHEDRTVGYKQKNTSLEQLGTIKYILEKEHSGKKISNNAKNTLLSRLYFNIAKYYMFNNEKISAIIYIIRAIFKKPFLTQSKHYFYCLSLLLISRIPKEYTK